MSIEDADELFTSRGYWRLMVPRLLGGYVFFVGIGLFSLSEGVDLNKLMIVLGLTFLIIPVAQTVRYRLAAEKHRRLKETYGSRYVQLIEEGKIPISPEGILVLGAPWSHVRRLIPEEGIRIPPY